MRRYITTATVLVALLSAAVVAHAEPLGANAPSPATAAPSGGVADFTVFVDPISHAVFVKLPQGWRFAGKAEGLAPGALPPNVVTSMLPPEQSAPMRVARADDGAR